MKRVLLVLISLSFSVGVMADAKTEFIDAVVKSCGKSKDDAEKMATPGRSGNIVKWQTCSAASVDIEGCNVSCSAASSKIGN